MTFLHFTDREAAEPWEGELESDCLFERNDKSFWRVESVVKKQSMPNTVHVYLVRACHDTAEWLANWFRKPEGQ